MRSRIEVEHCEVSPAPRQHHACFPQRWRLAEHQELWERIYVKDLETDSSFTRLPTDGEDTPTACVWELGVICDERMAWRRYLFSARDAAAKRAWLEDVDTGQV